MKASSTFASGFVVMVCGLLAIVMPRYLLPVCEFLGKPVMKCSVMGKWEMVVGMILLGVGLGLLAPLGIWVRRILAVLVAFSGIAMLWIPLAVGYCPSPRMPCHHGTVPGLRILGGLVICVGLSIAWKAFREGRKS